MKRFTYKILIISVLFIIGCQHPAAIEFSAIDKNAVSTLDEENKERASELHRQANSFSDIGDHDAALQHLRQAISLVSYQNGMQSSFLHYSIGSAYARQRVFDSTLVHYQRALDIALSQAEQENWYISQMYNNIATVYLWENDHRQAMESIEKSIEHRANRNDAPFFNLTKARVFMTMNEADSAKLYLNRVVQSTQNTYLTIIATQHLANLYKAEEDYEQAYYRMLSLRDFIDHSSSSVNSNILRQQFNEMQLENENNALTLAKRTRELLLLSSVFVIVLLLGVIWLFVSRARKREQSHLQAKREQELKDKATIAEQENRLLKQEKELILLHEKAAVLRESLFRRLAVSEKIPSLDIAKSQDKKECFKKIILEKSDWKELVETIDDVFNGFSKRLGKVFPALSDDDIRFCCLLKIDVSMQDLADIYCISKAGITKRKMRLKKDKFEITDSELDLNAFLMMF